MWVWLPPLAGICAMAVFAQELGPWARLAAATIGMLLMFKIAVLLRTAPQRRPTGAGLVLFLTVWPGMDAELLSRRAQPPDETGPRFITGWLIFAGGLAAIVAIAAFMPQISPGLAGWLGLAALLLAIHFGLSHMLTSLVWLAGFPVRPLFERPHASRSLWEFWTRRWNIAFVEMDRVLFLPPLKRALGVRGGIVGVFLISGLLHEMAISYPADAGWGGPLAYFIIQGAVVMIERRFRIRSWFWTVFWVTAPLPLLMHSPFRKVIILPIFSALTGLLLQFSLEWTFGWLIWIMGCAHFLVLVASLQVPRRLRWREELPRLSPFNQKLMWTYGVFIVMTILGFGLLTLLFRAEFLAGTPLAIALSVFIAAFWLARVLVDLFYYESQDWPQGPAFVVGHVLLTSLFVFLTVTYGGLAVWHLTR